MRLAMAGHQLDSGSVLIARSLVEGRGSELVEKDTKTHASRRIGWIGVQYSNSIATANDANNELCMRCIPFCVVLRLLSGPKRRPAVGAE